MKLTIKSLGRIREAELDIRPMTVFVGPNNTNKTWTAYSLYGLVRRLSVFRGPAMVPGIDVLPGSLPPELEQRIAASASSIVQRIRTTQAEPLVAVDVSRREVIGDLVLPNFLTFTLNTAALARVLAIRPEDLSQANVSLTVDKETFTDNAILDRISVATNRNESLLTLRAFEHDAEEPTTGASWGRLAFAPEHGEVWRSIVRSFVESLVVALYNRPVALPAERKAIAAFYQMFASGFRRSTEEGIINIPTADFISMLEQSLFMRNQRPAFPDLFDLLEHELMGGTVDFTRAEPQAKELTFTPKEGPSLRMHATASMVRSLAGLDLYLHCLARRGDFLVIDEPEMNAHPQAQLRTVELLARLVNSGVSVVVTTHSPYFIDHLNNLIEGSRANERARSLLAPKFKPGARSPWLSPDNVSVYLFSEKGEVSDVFDRTNAQIDVTTFSEASDYVGNLYARLLEAQPKK